MDKEKIVSDYARWLFAIKNCSESTIKRYQENLERFLIFLDKERGKGIFEAMTEDIEEYMYKSVRIGNKGNTRLNKIIVIKGFYKYLYYKKMIPEDITNIPNPKKKQTFVPAFSKDEILKIFDAINIKDKGCLIKICMIILGAFGGLRVSEIFNLNMEDIIIEGNRVRLNIKGKGDYYRWVDLWKYASRFLMEMYYKRVNEGARVGDTFLIKNGKRLYQENMDYILKALCKEARIRKVRESFHMLRAGHIQTLRHIKGFDLPAVANRVGHKHISTTDTYIQDRHRIMKIYPSLNQYWDDFRIMMTEKGFNYE